MSLFLISNGDYTSGIHPTQLTQDNLNKALIIEAKDAFDPSFKEAMIAFSEMTGTPAGDVVVNKLSHTMGII